MTTAADNPCDARQATASATQFARLATALVAWYREHARDLPWRRTRDPYRIWLSEVMLQQTRVETVSAYYQRFLQRFATLADLAAAPLDDVLKSWENLGYYARARHLHAAARYLCDHHGGQIPQDLPTLLRVPGIGRYTAGAVLSVAFGQAWPAVDGNVRRVLSRMFAIAESIDKPATQQILYDLAGRLVQQAEPAALNQALMELGATVCKPRRPACPDCPVQDDCVAWRRGLQALLPVRRQRKPVPHHDATAAILVDDQGRILLVQRPAKGLLGGLWKFPGGRRNPDESLQDALRRTVLAEVGLHITVGATLAAAHHAYTHFTTTVHAFAALLMGGRANARQCAAWRWVNTEACDALALSNVDRQILQAVRHLPADIRPA